MMGYFANGTEGEIYHETYCYRCIHMLPEPYGCPCDTAHLLWNYDECNNDNSILHKMIPRKGVKNKQCIFFAQKDGEIHNQGVEYKTNEWKPPNKRV